MNLFDQIPEPVSKELFTTLLLADNIRVERIISFGQKSPDAFWYDQPDHEWVLLLEGSAQLRVDDRQVDLSPGDYLNIPAGCRHRVEKTDPDRRTVWLAIFYKNG